MCALTVFNSVSTCIVHVSSELPKLPEASGDIVGVSRFNTQRLHWITALWTIDWGIVTSRPMACCLVICWPQRSPTSLYLRNPNIWHACCIGCWRFQKSDNQISSKNPVGRWPIVTWQRKHWPEVLLTLYLRFCSLCISGSARLSPSIIVFAQICPQEGRRSLDRCVWVKTLETVTTTLWPRWPPLSRPCSNCSRICSLLGRPMMTSQLCVQSLKSGADIWQVLLWQLPSTTIWFKVSREKMTTVSTTIDLKSAHNCEVWPKFKITSRSSAAAALQDLANTATTINYHLIQYRTKN